MKQALLVGVLLSATSEIALSGGIFIHNGYLSGEEYLRLDSAKRQMYAIGAVDGLFLAPLMGSSEKRSSALGHAWRA